MSNLRFYILLALAAFAVLTLVGIHLNMQKIAFALEGARTDAQREVRQAELNGQ